MVSVSAPPSTLVRTSHALTIKVGGNTIGLINGWTPAQSRTVTPIFELDIDNSGDPVECMPGNMSGMTVSINRYDIYTQRMEEAFGTTDLTMLSRQGQPFEVFEIWVSPGNSEEVDRFIYSGCWFTSLGRQLRSDDTRLVNVNASLIYTKKLRVSGITGKLMTTIAKQNWNLPGL